MPEAVIVATHDRRSAGPARARSHPSAGRLTRRSWGRWPRCRSSIPRHSDLMLAADCQVASRDSTWLAWSRCCSGTITCRYDGQPVLLLVAADHRMASTRSRPGGEVYISAG